MLLPLMIVLGFWRGVLGADYAVCRFNAHEECRVFSLYPDENFPRNETELKDKCLKFSEVKDCISEYMTNCSVEGHEEDYTRKYMTDLQRVRRLKDYLRLINVTTEICQENSELHRRFVVDMACFIQMMERNNRDQMCRDYTRNAESLLRYRMNRLRPETKTGPNDFYGCMNVILSMNCFVELFDSECSPFAKDTAIEILEKASSLFYQCPPSVRIDILELLDDFKSATKKDIHVRHLLEDDSFLWERHPLQPNTAERV